MRPRHTRTIRGFNLVEAAIVLGVIGLVIGGIWTAAASVQANMRINKVASDVTVIINNARKIFPLGNFPASGFTNVNTAAFHAGVFPQDFAMQSATSAVSPEGVIYVLQTSCNASNLCPAFALQIFLRNNPGTAYRNSLTTSECIAVAQRLNGSADLMRFFVTNVGGMSSVQHYPPVNPITITCSSATGYLDFRYRP